MKSKALQNWEKTRARGKARYIVVNGVLSYGLPMFIAMTLVAHHDNLSAKFVAISAALWLLGGAVFGILTWFLLESHYRKATRNDAA